MHVAKTKLFDTLNLLASAPNVLKIYTYRKIH